MRSRATSAPDGSWRSSTSRVRFPDRVLFAMSCIGSVSCGSGVSRGAGAAPSLAAGAAWRVGSGADGDAASAAASGVRVGSVRVTAHDPDDATDVFLVPALTVDVVRVPVAGEEPADHVPQVLVACGLAGRLRGLHTGGHRSAVCVGARALTGSPRSAQGALE